MKTLITLLLIIVSTITTAQNNVKTPTIVFKVPLGVTVIKNGISFTLSEILEDSRCPSDVDCIQAGSAKVTVAIADKQNELVKKVVLFKNGKQPYFFENEKYVYQAMKLNPYPTTAISNTMDYVLLISETPKISE